jgi:hypothetical protein
LCIFLDDDDDTCQSDGQIHHYHIAKDDWSLVLKLIHNPAAQAATAATVGGIAEFISKELLPTIVWLDHQSTAQVAMAHNYQVDAVLFRGNETKDSKLSNRISQEPPLQS